MWAFPARRACERGPHDDVARRLFTNDATADFSAFGGPRCSARELGAYLQQVLAQIHGIQHSISTTLLEFESGGRVRAQTVGQVPMSMLKDDGTLHVYFCGLWYRDVLVRTPQGWRIHERVQEKSWTYNMPGGDR